MKARRGLRTGEALSLVAAILLFVLMFFDWWEVGIGRESGGGLAAVNLFDRGQDAWQTLEVIPLFLMLAIVVAVGVALLRLTGSDWEPTIPLGAAVCILGAVAAALILYRMISPPGVSEFEAIPYERSLEPPIFLALVAALGIGYGGWRSMRDEGTSFAAIAKRLESPRRPAKPESSRGGKPAARTKP